MNRNAKILIGIVISICIVSAIFKATDPHFTFGGEKFRTPFWSSLFFIVLAVMLIISFFV